MREREPKRGDRVEMVMIAVLAVATIAGGAGSIILALQALFG